MVTQTTAVASTSEVAVAKTEMEEERIDYLIAELKGLNNNVQDKVLNGAFTKPEEDF